MSLRAFVAASGLLHLAAFALVQYPPLESGTASTASRVTLILSRSQAAPESAAHAAPASAARRPSPLVHQATSHDVGPTSQAPHRLASSAAATAAPAPAAAAPPQLRTVKTMPAKNTTQPPTQTPVRGSLETRDASDAVAAKTAEATSELHKLLSANFTYPPLARRRGWEGEVRLSLRLEPDGRLTHIHIVKSSGFAILDKSALKSARELGLAPAAARWLQGDWFDVILPVRYQLNDG